MSLLISWLAVLSVLRAVIEISNCCCWTISPSSSTRFCFSYLGTVLLIECMLIILHLLRNWPFFHCEMSLFESHNNFALSLFFFHINGVIQPLLLLLFVWIFFTLYFQTICIFESKCVSHRHPKVGSCILISLTISAFD